MRSAPYLVAVVAATAVLSACSSPSATPVVVYVTATQVALAPTQAGTALFGPTAALDENPIPTLVRTFPPLATATKTPLPKKPITLTPSFTPEFTDTPEPTFPAQKCRAMQPNGFTTLYQRDRSLQAALGCAQSGPVPINSATLNFENGTMIWASAFADQPRKVIYALYNNGAYQRFDDTWADGVDPVDTGEAAPAGRKAPIRGFGKVWHANPNAHSALGWALGDEAGTTAQIQRFDRGEMIYIANLNMTYILSSGKWRADPTRF